MEIKNVKTVFFFYICGINRWDTGVKKADDWLGSPPRR